MAESLLARYSVEFGEKGKAQLARDIDAVVAGLIKAERQEKVFAAVLEGGAGKAAQALARQMVAAEKLATAHKNVGLAFGLASAAVMGFVRAGLAGTTEGEQLGVQMLLLSREIAAIALPAVRALTDGIARLTTWFRSLSGDQQAMISRVVAFGAAFLAASLILPKLVVGIRAMSAAMTLLAANPILAIVAGLTALLLSSEEGRASLGRIFEAFKPALTAVGGLFTAIWKLLEPIITALGSVLPPLIEALVPAFEAVAQVIKGIVGFITDIVNGIRSLLEEAGLIEARAARAGSAARTREAVTAQGRGPGDVRSFFSAFQSAALKQDTIPARQLAVQERIEQNTRPPGVEPLPPPPPIA